MPFGMFCLYANTKICFTKGNRKNLPRSNDINYFNYRQHNILDMTMQKFTQYVYLSSLSMYI